jgi:AcrR family transcriptional regulator
MTEPVKRQYDSTRRQAQARLTRAHIRDVAAELFVERGYVATTIAAIAERAEVSAQTVFATFGNKAALLSEAIDVALAGDDEPIAVAQRGEWMAMIATDDPEAAAAGFAAVATAVVERAGLLLNVADAAAQHDPDLHPKWVAGHRGRRQDMAGAVGAFAGNGLLRPGLTVDEATDVLWILTSPGTYCSFVLILDWTTDQYRDWLGATIRRTLFEPT